MISLSIYICTNITNEIKMCSRQSFNSTNNGIGINFEVFFLFAVVAATTNLYCCTSHRHLYVRWLVPPSCFVLFAVCLIERILVRSQANSQMICSKRIHFATFCYVYHPMCLCASACTHLNSFYIDELMHIHSGAPDVLCLCSSAGLKNKLTNIFAMN